MAPTTRASASSSPTPSLAWRSAICWPSSVAIPLGFLIGMSPLMSRALDPFIQVMKPISPLAWMPLALYTIKDSGISAIFVIFICSLWPMLINTAFGVASVRREWLNVAKTLEMPAWRTACRVILPAAAPTILTGMRISIGIAWLVIVAAEMLVGGTGHRLLRLERVEQPVDHQRHHGDPVHRPGRHGAGPADGAAAAARVLCRLERRDGVRPYARRVPRGEGGP